jgi:hypothetical protein
MRSSFTTTYALYLCRKAYTFTFSPLLYFIGWTASAATEEGKFKREKRLRISDSSFRENEISDVMAEHGRYRHIHHNTVYSIYMYMYLYYIDPILDKTKVKSPSSPQDGETQINY